MGVNQAKPLSIGLVLHHHCLEQCTFASACLPDYIDMVETVSLADAKRPMRRSAACFTEQGDDVIVEFHPCIVTNSFQMDRTADVLRVHIRGSMTGEQAC